MQEFSKNIIKCLKLVLGLRRRPLPSVLTPGEKVCGSSEEGALISSFLSLAVGMLCSWGLGVTVSPVRVENTKPPAGCLGLALLLGTTSTSALAPGCCIWFLTATGGVGVGGGSRWF